jgi:hypothetical protein
MGHRHIGMVEQVSNKIIFLIVIAIIPYSGKFRGSTLVMHHAAKKCGHPQIISVKDQLQLSELRLKLRKRAMNLPMVNSLFFFGI